MHKNYLDSTICDILGHCAENTYVEIQIRASTISQQLAIITPCAETFILLCSLSLSLSHTHTHYNSMPFTHSVTTTALNRLVVVVAAAGGTTTSEILSRQNLA